MEQENMTTAIMVAIGFGCFLCACIGMLIGVMIGVGVETKKSYTHSDMTPAERKKFDSAFAKMNEAYNELNGV
jgi:hypothetical protein